MRLFLAIDVPVETKNSIGQQLLPYLKRYPMFRWVEPQQYHITLQFYGEQTSETDVISKIEEAIFETVPFEISLDSGVGFMRGDMVVALSVNRSQHLNALVRTLDAKLGFERQRSFFPHITIARGRVPSKQQYLMLKKKFSAIRIHDEFEVKDLALIKSELTSNGPIYTTVHEFTLFTDEELLPEDGE